MNETDPIEEARSPWAGWVVAICHGGRYLGRIVDSQPSLELAPVYELNVRVAAAPPAEQGAAPRMAVVYACVPVLMLSGWRAMQLPEDALVVQLEHLTLRERQRLMAAAQQGAEMVSEMRREDSPIAQPRILVPR
jgi:hypothetical protein